MVISETLEFLQGILEILRRKLETLRRLSEIPQRLYKAFPPDPEHNPEPPLVEDTDKEEEQDFSDQSRQQE